MKHQPTIIALAGPNRVGKSTLAYALEAAAPTRVILESFAWPIHHTLGLMGFNRDEAAKEVHGKGDRMKAAMGAFGGLLGARPEIVFMTPVAAKGLDI